MDCKRHNWTPLFLCMLLYLPVPLATAARETATADAATLLHQAGTAYHGGDLEAAARDWSAAASKYNAQDNHNAESRALAQAATANQGLGKFQAAIGQLEQARELAASGDDRNWQARLTNQLGSALLYLPDTEAAEPLLNEALNLARAQHDKSLEASALNNLGRVEQLKGNNAAALEHYERSLSRSTAPADTARTAASAGELALAANDPAAANDYLQQALTAAGKLPDTHDTVYLLIRIARLQQQLADTLPTRKTALTQSAYTGLQKADTMAQRIGDPRAQSWTAGYLGELYESQGRLDEAMDLTRRALYAIQALHAPELKFRWEWQQGRLLKAQDDSDNAIKSYRKAITTLHSVRAELAASLEQSQQSYHRLVSPLFLEYADLLLQQGEAADDPEAAQRALVEARDAVELLKTVELQDYFQDDCVSLARTRVQGLDETLSATTAVIYPILFPDRTDLLLSTSTGLSRHTIPVTAERMTAEVRDFRYKLEKRTTRQYMRPARQLYDWLIRPIEKELTTHGIDTLVIVPDAALRTIPMAALHDGKQFLIHKYALASTPSLKLTDPRPIRAQNIDILLNGLTESVQGYPDLPNVAIELENLQSMYGGRVLENSGFSNKAFQDALADHPYNVVHIASHGKFEGKVSDSFILTHHGKLTMDNLEQYIGLSQIRVDQPVELLTLSACQTAAGDEWAGLGLAGVAIKAGARSALATLWYVNDQVTSELITKFYHRLGEPDTTKAKALQQAQLEILADMRYRHPAYWSPYLLIGNWL